MTGEDGKNLLQERPKKENDRTPPLTVPTAPKRGHSHITSMSFSKGRNIFPDFRLLGIMPVLSSRHIHLIHNRPPYMETRTRPCYR